MIAEANVHRVSPVADISFSRTHGPGDPEYDLLLAKLKFYGVGKSSGAKDQHMVADVFFAQTPPGVVPKFVTADGPVANGLARASGNPRVDMTQPFTVTIDGREIVVLYLQ